MNVEHLPRELISALLDGELDTVERATVDEHVETCPDCLRALEQLTSVRDLVASLPRLEAPASVIEAALRPPATVHHLVRGRRKWAVAAAAAALVISLAGLAAPPADEQPPIDAFVTRHVGVNVGNQTAAEVLFAVTGR